MALRTLKGNNSIAPIILKTRPIVKPAMANGNRNIPPIKRKTPTTNASGQQRASKMNHKSIAITVFISYVFYSLNKLLSDS